MIEHGAREVKRDDRSVMESERKVLTVAELAKELRISTSLAYRQVREGKIYSIRCGDRYLIPARALEGLLSGEQRQTAGGQAAAE